MDDKILILVDGLLGSELIKQTGWNYLSRKKDDIDIVNNVNEFFDLVDKINPDVIINCIGYTDTYNPFI